MSDDHLLREILASPLDDLPPKRSGAWWLFPSGVVLVALVATLVFTRAGSPTVETTVLDIADAAGTTNASDSSLTADGEASTVTVVQVAAQPEPSVHHELVALGEGKIMMVGGLIPDVGEARPLEGTWFLDVNDRTWELSTPDPAPSPRAAHTVALHPPTGRVVLFGGGSIPSRGCVRVRFCPGPADNQLWQYDPEAGSWMNMTPEDPDENSWPMARFGARFAYEPVTERLIMFGGSEVFGPRLTPTFYDETWAYDPVTNTWEDLTVGDGPAPGGRSFYGMVWNDEAERIILFGGDGPTGTEDDHLWVFDPSTTTWEDRGVRDGEPRDRWFHAMVPDPQSDRIVVIGGSGSVFTAIASGTARTISALNEVWTWSDAEGWMAANGAVEPLSPVSAATDPETSSIVVYDGHEVLAYDAAVDRWSVLIGRSEGG